MAVRHSNRRRSSGRAGSKNSKSPSLHLPRVAASTAGWKQLAHDVARGKKRATKPPDFDEVLGQFSDALALAETAHEVLDAAQERDGIGRAIGSAVMTLACGLTELRRAYSALDLAILRARRGRAP